MAVQQARAVSSDTLDPFERWYAHPFSKPPYPRRYPLRHAQLSEKLAGFLEGVLFFRSAAASAPFPPATLSFLEKGTRSVKVKGHFPTKHPCSDVWKCKERWIGRDGVGAIQTHMHTKGGRE